jgi:2'-5' RNA ligase
MSGVRYAVYFVPAAETDLYRFGSTVIGYDCYRGVPVPCLSALRVDFPDWGDLTQEPRGYGFHATLKAPFRVVPDAGERDLFASLDRLAATFDGAPAFRPRVALMDGFVAIVPDRMPPALSALADACVEAFEPVRAPLSEPERRRRLAAGLGPDQIVNLDRWGYPYVFKNFRFHMTLTGRLSSERAETIRGRLSGLLDETIGDRAIVVDRLALLRQPGPGHAFEVARVAPIGLMRDDGPSSPE